VQEKRQAGRQENSSGQRRQIPDPFAFPANGSVGFKSLNVRGFVLAAFIAVIVLIWLNEILDIPHLVFGAPSTLINWKEACFETFLIASVCFFVMIYLSHVIAHAATAYERLLRERDFNTRLMRISPAFIVGIGAHGRIILINESMLHALGYISEELVDKDYIETLVPERDRQEFLDVLEGIVVSAESTKIESRILTKAGNEIIVEWHLTPVFKGGGVLDLFFGIGIDTTDRKRLEIQLAQARKMEAMGTLAGGIAHDFNNILSSLMGYSELVKDDLEESNMSCIYIDEVIKASERARDLVKQILMFSRRVEVEPRTVMVHLIVKEALKLLRASIPKTIDIRHQIDPDNDVVFADPTRIHQVIMNLCTNAFQSMDEKGGLLYVGLEHVDVDADLAGDKPGLYEGLYVRLTVRDTGCGMDRYTIKRIFDPFFTTKEKGRGTGLGMSTVHGIVTAMNGYIDVESVLGKGTCISVYMPSVSAGRQDISRTSNIVEKGSGERILVVDDEQTIVESLKEMLGRIGYKVTGVGQSMYALEVFREDSGQFDLVITDYTMPGMTGIQLAREMIKIRPGVPIVIMTGYSENVDINRVQTEDIAGFVEKPFSRYEMASTIYEILHAGHSFC